MAYCAYTLNIVYALGLVDWLQAILIVADVTPIVGRVAATVAFGAVAARIAVIQRERVLSSLNTRTPVISGRVALGAVVIAKVVNLFVAIVTNIFKSHELGLLMTIKAMQGGVFVN